MKTHSDHLQAIDYAMAELSAHCSDDRLSPIGLGIVTTGRQALDTLLAARPVGLAPQAAPLCMVDLLGRALAYVETYDPENRDMMRDQRDELAHSIRNALQVATLAKGEELSGQEARDVRAVVLEALRTAEKAIDFAMGSVPTSTSAHIQLSFDRNAVRAGIAAAEAAPHSPSLDVLAALREGRDFIAAALDCTREDTADFIANNGEDVEARLSEALAGAAATAPRPISASLSLAPGVCLYLDASTAHLPASDLSLLDRDNVPGISVKPHRHGAWIDTKHGQDDSETNAEDRKALAEAGYSPALADILAHARALGCNWVNLDSDADTVPGLPTYEHEAPTS